MSDGEAKVQLEVHDATATITLNRPEVLNALDMEAIDQLSDAVDRAGADRAVRVVHITGAGRAFCAGGDVKNMLGEVMKQPGLPPEVLARQGARKLHAAITELRRMPKPVVCAVNGACAGAGVGLALAGDIVWASRSATFNLAYTSIGLSPDGGTTYFLPRAVGEKMAMELFLTSREVTSEEAERIGLVSRVIDDEAFGMTVAEVVGKLARGATMSYATAKRLVQESLREGLETQLEAETQGVAQTIVSQDFMEGVQAFMQKRRPEFKNR